MALDLRLVDEIHARMLVRYGAAWINLWAGVDPALVKADWANELHGMSVDKIKFGLVNLPLDKPPTLGQFKHLCSNMPAYVQRSLPLPKADPERVAKIVGTLRTRLAAQPPMKWAHDLKAREKRGENLTLAQRALWREALNKQPMQQIGSHSPIDPNSLPPGMRPTASSTREEFDHVEA